MRSIAIAAVVGLVSIFASTSNAETGTTTRVTNPKQHAALGNGGYLFRQKADQILKELDLQPGDSVADIGAGDGWWSERFGEAVGATGTVHAAEVTQKLVDQMKNKFANKPQIKPYLCKPDSLELAEDCCDMAFFSYVYHHLPKDGRVDYLKQLTKVVKPMGRLVVVEKYSEIAARGKDHGTQLSAVIAEAEQAGWIPVRCELIAGTETYLAIFVQKDLFGAAAAQETKPARQQKPQEQPERKKAA